MRDDDPPAGDPRGEVRQTPGDVFVAQAMKTVAPHAFPVEGLRDGVAVGRFGMVPVKGRVEAGHLKHVGQEFPDRPDRRQIVRLVERGERNVGLQRPDHRIIHRHMAVVDRPAMDHPMPDRHRHGPAQPLPQPRAEKGQRAGNPVAGFGRQGNAAVLAAILAAILDDQPGRRADPLDPAAQAHRQRPVRRVEQLELDAGGTGVDDQDRLGHAHLGHGGFTPSPAARSAAGARTAPPRRRRPCAS